MEINEYNFEEVEEYLLKKGLLHYINYTPFGKSENDIVFSILKESINHGSYNEEGGRYCGAYDMRTVSDLFRLSKTYIPSLRLSELYSILITLLQEKRIHSWVCGSIRKRVYAKGFGFFNSLPTDEFNFDFAPYKILGNACHYGYDKQSKDWIYFEKVFLNKII